MRKSAVLGLFFGLACLVSGTANAAGCVTLPYTLTAGTTAVAAQVMGNFNATATCVNAVINSSDNIIANYNPLTNPGFLTGNPSGSTKTAFSSQGTAIQAGVRQAQGIFGITNTTFSATACSGGTTNGNCDLIGEYVGTVLNGGLLNGFASNRLLSVASGWNAANQAGLSVSGGAWIDELDINNLDANFGETAGAAGMLVPFTYGINLVGSQGVISGSTFYRNTAAIVISTISTSAGPSWNRGLVCGAFAPGGDVRQACIADYSSALTSYDIRGTHPTAGIDGTNGTFPTYFIKGPASTYWDGNGNAKFATGVLNNGGGGVLPGIYSGGGFFWEGLVYNSTNATQQNGLLVTTNWATADGTKVLDVGNTVFGTGVYTSYFAVATDGTISTTTNTNMSLGGFLQIAQASPASGAACSVGRFVADTGFLYTCTASGAWKRVAVVGGY